MAIINELQNLGNAVRERTSTTALLTMNEMADKVRKIPYPQTDTITITANGSYSAPTGIDGYSKVDVNVPDPELEEISITENGIYLPNTFGFSEVEVNVPNPELEEITIIENGTYLPDSFGYSKVDVNVQPTLESITITENGTYTPQENIDGYNEIIVNTPVPVEPVIQEIEITENGTYSATDGVDGYNPIIVNVPTGGGGDIEVEPIVLTGDCSYACAGHLSSKYMEMFGDSISTSDITDSSYMFDYNTAERIPFDVNLKQGSAVTMRTMFGSMFNLTVAPNVNNAKPEVISYLFTQCFNLRELPADFSANWNWDTLHTLTSYNGGYVFNKCYSLRTIPSHFLENMWNNASGTYSNYYYAFYYCLALDEIVNLGVTTRTFTSNTFASTFDSCHRLANLIFSVNEDGTPKTANWKKQTINLTEAGYVLPSSEGDILNYNSGITADKKVYDDATYAALKDDPDWFTLDRNYSRYNHDSAVNTINSLPDCSAYLATQTGTSNNNTIKFIGNSGSKTDGGAINTLTEEEIAVATSRGWTVSLV